MTDPDDTARLWVYRGPPEALDAVRFAAVAVKRIDPSQNHVGILHRTEGGGAKFLNLAWHKDLRNGAARPPLVVAQPDLPRSRDRSVAAMCRLVWQRHRDAGLPYGLRFRAGRFDPVSARLVLDKDAAGLTCATFVLGIYASCGLQLIDCTRWPARDDDGPWHQRVLALLEQKGAAPEHVTAVSEELGCARFRPEEIAGACLVDGWPAPFEDVKAASEKVVEQLAAAEPMAG